MGPVQGLCISHGVVKCGILLKDQVSLTTHFWRIKGQYSVSVCMCYLRIPFVSVRGIITYSLC